jgi:uncharacterized protein
MSQPDGTSESAPAAAAPLDAFVDPGECRMTTAVLPESPAPISPTPTTEASTSPTFGPVARADLLVNIDFVRGVALLGILLVNTASFFAPTTVASGLSAFAALSPLDLAVSLFVTVFVAGKFISTFSMLFGYGLSGQVERAHEAGSSPGKFALRRLGVLAAFGLLHGLLLWYGDVLFIYASLGVLWRTNTPGSLLVIAGVLLGLLVLYSAVGETFGVVIADNESATRQGDFNPAAWQSGEAAAYRDGPYWRTVPYRLGMWLIIIVAVVLWVWVQIVGMFALGAWMWKKRFFSPEQAALRRRVLLVFWPVGLTLAVASLTLHGVALQNSSRVTWAIAGAVGALAVVTLPLGYVSGLALLAERLPGWLVNTVASAGRMALTVYLSETVVATFLSYHWGLGWFGRVSPWQQAVVAVAVWAGLVLMSRLWLSVFAQGPMEWLWRKLEYGRLPKASSAA